MDNVKSIIIVFFVISFLFFIVALVSIALLHRNNKRLPERAIDDRRISSRRAGERRCENRRGSDRRNNDRRVSDRRIREGTVFDRRNIFNGLSPNFSQVSN